MIELVSSPPKLSTRMRVQVGLMVVVTGLIVGTVYLIYTAPLPDGTPAPGAADSLARLWSQKPLMLLGASVALMLMPLVIGWGKCTFRIEPDRLTMTSNLPQPLKNRLTDWSVRRDEIHSIELRAVSGQHAQANGLWLVTATGTKRFGASPWYRLDQSVESQEPPLRLVFRMADVIERARASSLVRALEQSGYAVTMPTDAASVDGFARAKSGRAVAAISISAALLAVAEMALHPPAYLGPPPWPAVIGSGVLAAALTYGVLKNVQSIQAPEKMAAPLVLGACIALLMWAVAPRINAATAVTDTEWVFVYDGGGVFIAQSDGPPPLDLFAARGRIAEAGWAPGDTLEVPVVRGALRFWQYDRRTTHSRIENGPAN